MPTEQVDITKAVNREPAFREKNPLGTLPVLELDDGTHIAESVAICRYFEETHPAPPLMGIDARDRAVVEMWQRRMELELFIPVAQVFRNGHPFFAGREFVAGPRYTIADITALCGIDFGRVSKIRIPAELAHLSRWHAAVSARPSASA